MVSRRSLLVAVTLVIAVSMTSLIYPVFSRAAEDKCAQPASQQKKKQGKKFENEGEQCESQGKCGKDGKCDLEKGGPMPMLPMLPMPMPMPPMDMPMMPMNCGASTVGNVGGVFRTGEAATTSTSTAQKDPNCPNNSNPYADYQQPSVSSNINSNTSGVQSTAAQNVSDLFHDLFGDSGTGFSDNTSTSTVVKPTPASTSTQRATPFVGNPGVIEINPGVSGNIEFSDNGATIHIRRESGGTTVAGFYGSDTRAAPTGLVQGWCASRPWTTNFLARIIPSGFFDGLCTLRGYAVGITPTAPNSSHSPIVEVPRQYSTSTFSAPLPQSAPRPKPVQPSGRADIWAVPTSVRLGSRATVFWNATGVVSCQETSPEGGFTHTTISGGAETVAISGPTTFAISCVTASGAHITNYTTVNLAN